MTVGLGYTKADVDLRSGSLVVQLRNDFEAVKLFKAWLDAQTDEALTALGYTQDDVTLLRGSYTDLVALYGVAWGTTAPPGASNYFFQARRLTGIA